VNYVLQVSPEVECGLTLGWTASANTTTIGTSVGDPHDPHVFGPPGSGSVFIIQRYGYGSKSFPFYWQVIRKNMKKKNYFLASLKLMKKEVGSGFGSGSISQRYESGEPDPDPHQNVTGPQH
jgi:hypothetical protein